MTKAEKMREIAHYLDKMDEFMLNLARVNPDVTALATLAKGNAMQRDLRAWADHEDDPRGKKCEAVIYFGNGHQSTARCERIDPHDGTEDDPHEAHHHRTSQRLHWAGDEGMTDFFDESPL